MLETSIVESGILQLTLMRPEKRNAVTQEMRKALRTALKTAREGGAKAIILIGAGKHFCAGGDIMSMKDMEPSDGRARMLDVKTTAEDLYFSPVPIVCAVRGHAAGAGFSISMLTDKVIASSTAKFTASFGKIGLIPDWGMLLTLAQRTGQQQASEILQACATIDAEQGASFGIVDTIVPDDELEEEALRHARLIRDTQNKATLAVRAHFKERQRASLQEVLDLEVDQQSELFQSDFFLQKLKEFLDRG